MSTVAVVALFIVGFADGARIMIGRIRRMRHRNQLLDTVRDKQLRRQIRQQHDADEAVRRHLTPDLWFGIGGRGLFDPHWHGVRPS